MCFVSFVVLTAAALLTVPFPAIGSPLLDSLACVQQQVNEAKDKWSVRADPIFMFDVCAFLKETNLTTCPKSLVSNRLAMKLGWYAVFVCDRRDAGQVLVCEGVEHGAGNCSDYHQKRLAYEESILSRCSNKQLDGSEGSPVNNETIAVLKEIHALETLRFQEQHTAELQPQKDANTCSEVFAQLLFLDGSSVRLSEHSAESDEIFT